MSDYLHALRGNDKLQGLFLIIGATVLFSIKGIMIKLAYQWGLDTLTLMTLRMLFSLPFYLAMIVYCRKELKLHSSNPTIFLQVIAFGVVGYYGASYLDLLGLNYVTASFERIVIYSYPCMVVILTALFLNKRPSRLEVLALLVCYLGIGVVYLKDQAILGSDVRTGTLLLLLSALCFSIFMIGSEKVLAKMGSELFTSLAMTAASLAVLCHFFFNHNVSDLVVSGKLLVLAIVLALVSTVLPVYMLGRGIKALGASRASIISIFGPAITPIFAFLVLGEVFTLFHGIGLMLVIAGMFMLQTKRAAKS